MQRRQGRVRRDRHGFGQIDGPSVESAHHAHHRHPGLGITGPDRGLQGAGPTPARQQRAMQIDAAMGGPVEHVLAQQFAIRHDHRQIAVQAGIHSRAFEGVGLPHGQAEAERGDLHRGRSQAMATPGGPVRLSNDAGHGRARRE